MERVLTLVDKKELSLTGIDEVLSFDDKEIVLKSDGEKIFIKGIGLSIKNFDGEEKRFDAEGEVSSITYKSGAPSIKKLFK